MTLPLTLLIGLLAADPLAPGDHVRRLEADARTRSYLVHVPPGYDAKKPTPVVLVFHGAGINGPRMAGFCGMNEKADEAGFLAVYPNGTGIGDLVLTWNAGGFSGSLANNRPDDVKFVALLLDDLATVVSVDRQRVFAAGHSNGAMLCYRLGIEMPERIAAIAAVGGTLTTGEVQLRRPVPLVHFHGTADAVVPYAGLDPSAPAILTVKPVDETVRIWAKANGCSEEPEVGTLEDRYDDGTVVQRHGYGGCRAGSEVVLYAIEGGGHTWPGRTPWLPVLGRSTAEISANDVIWEFFQRHALDGSGRWLNPQ